MPQTIHEVIKQHQTFYEVLPYYSAPGIRVGFDIDVYGIRTGPERESGRDYRLVYNELKKLVETIHVGEPCSLEVITFGSRVVFDTKRQFQQEDMLRVRITRHGFHEVPGEEEEHALKEVKERLHELGVTHG